MFKKQILPVFILFFLVLFSACGEIDPVAAANDTTPPVVSITSPADGATMSSDFIITAQASDAESAISVLNFYLNDVKVDTVYATNVTTGLQNFASSTILLDALQAGDNVIKVIGMNGKLLTTEVSVTVSKSGGPDDTTAPLLSVLAPTTGQTKSNDFTVSVNTSDAESGIAAVRFYIDGVSHGAVAGQAGVTNYESSLLRITNLSEGAHTITVVAVNGVSLETTNTVSITVLYPTVNDTIFSTLQAIEPVGPTQSFALDVLAPYFSWVNGEVTGVLSYNIYVTDLAETAVYFALEGIPPTLSTIKFGEAPANVFQFDCTPDDPSTMTADLVPGVAYVYSITAMNISDSSNAVPENDIGFARVQFTVSGTRAPADRKALASSRPLPYADFLKIRQAMRTK